MKPLYYIPHVSLLAAGVESTLSCFPLESMHCLKPENGNHGALSGIRTELPTENTRQRHSLISYKLMYLPTMPHVYIQHLMSHTRVFLLFERARRASGWWNFCDDNELNWTLMMLLLLTCLISVCTIMWVTLLNSRPCVCVCATMTDIFCNLCWDARLNW